MWFVVSYHECIEQVWLLPFEMKKASTYVAITSRIYALLCMWTSRATRPNHKSDLTVNSLLIGPVINPVCSTPPECDFKPLI